MSIVAVVNVNVNTTDRWDRDWDEAQVISELNAQSKANGDGNTFSQQNGQAGNLTYDYTLSSDGNGHFTGSLVLSGWGWGDNIHTFHTQYSYPDTTKVLDDLTDQSYFLIHTGWHDARPNCP